MQSTDWWRRKDLDKGDLGRNRRVLLVRSRNPFTLKSGKTVTIRPADKDATLDGAFQRTITEAACLYFTTVLDPGSDAANQNHLHLDVKERRGGYRYCW